MSENYPQLPPTSNLILACHISGVYDVNRSTTLQDDNFELVAGAFSSTAEKSMASAADLGVAADRAYASYSEMAEQEASHRQAQRRSDTVWALKAHGDREGRLGVPAVRARGAPT